MRRSRTRCPSAPASDDARSSSSTSRPSPTSPASGALHAPAARTCRTPTVAEWYAQQRRARDRQRLRAALPAAGRRDRLRAARAATASRSGRSASSTIPSPSSSGASSTASRSYTPQLVSWNGSGFDLPVLHYRALIHGVTAARYWDWGDEDRDFKFNNYLGALSHAPPRPDGRARACTSRAPARRLDAMARLCGFPGKLGMDGSEVAAAVAARRARATCATIARPTSSTPTSLYQRFRLMRGELDAGEYAQEVALVRETHRGDRRAALEGVRRRVGRAPSRAEALRFSPGAPSGSGSPSSRSSRSRLPDVLARRSRAGSRTWRAGRRAS